MRREIRVRTPENVEFAFRLAGLGSRMAAAALDYFLVAFFAGLLAGAFLFLAAVAGATIPGVGTFASAGAVAILLVGLFLVLFGYFLFFELVWNGQTPGKRALGLRVVKDLGAGIGFTDSLVRNLVRVADLLPGLYGVGGVAVLLSARNKRLGDHAAGTIVIAADRAIAPAAAPERYERWNSLSEDAVVAARVRRETTAEETELLRDFWERRETLAPDARVALAARLATHLRRKLALPERAWLSDEQLVRDVLEIAAA